MMNNYQMIDMLVASGTTDMRINGYMSQSSTGKELKENKKPGLMFCIPDKLREALIMTIIRMAPGIRKKNELALQRKQEGNKKKRNCTKK